MSSKGLQPDPMPNIKLVLLGETTVGKTSIISVASDNPFTPDQSATVGACFHIKKMKAGNISIKFHIWDTAGQERFRALAPMYYRDAQFALLVYAIDNRESFDAIKDWHRQLQDDCSPMPHIVLVGNKIDLVNARQVTMEEGRSLAKELNSMFFEVSAKEDTPGVCRMLEEIAIDAVQYFGPDGTTSVKKLPVENTGGGGCC